MKNLNSTHRNAFAIKLNCCISILLFLSFQSNSQISGTVFRDFNANGVKNNSSTFNEPFVQGVKVKFTLATGVSDSTITDANGAYSFNSSQIPVGTSARIEFYTTKIGDYSSVSGTGSSTSIQFVNAPSSQTNFGVNYPLDYSQTNPSLIVSHYVGGTLTGGGANFNALIKFTNTGYTGEIVSAGYIPPTQVATHQQLGAVYGNAYSRVSKKVYSGAVLRRHVVFGPLGIGGLYETDPITNVVTNWLDIETLSGIDAGTDTRNSADPNNSIPSNPSTKSYDVLAFPLIGKQSLGDVEISEDGSKLYVVNLYQQSLVAIDVNTKALIGSYTINASTLGITCPQTDFRPWGLKYYRGKLYVGVVCSAESSQLASDLKAYVLEFDPSNTGAGFSIYYSCNLNYTREQADWNPWNVNSVAPGKAGEDSRNPQPILSNIEFDIDGSLILGLLDRHAMMFSSSNFPSNPSSSQTSVTPFSEGDILRVCNLSTGLSLEGTTGCAYNSTYSGGGEFYDDRRQGGSGNGNIKEDAGGALAILPGLNEIISTGIDEFDVNENGICWWDNTNGTRNRAYMVFDNSLTGTQGKASGLGDIELLSDAAPTEIGNRVWNDTNSNGIQDADELGIAGITVQLLDATNTIIATATTDANGNYYFSNDINGTTTSSAIYNIATLIPSTNYTVRIPNASGASKQAALGTNALTLTDAGSGINQDLIDNDGTLVGNDADKLFTTDLAGHNNHSYDFGFGAPAACTTPNAGADVIANSGATITLTGTNPTTGIWIASTTNPIGASLGATSNGIADVTFSSTASGVYSFIYTNGTCTDTMNVIVTAPKACLGNYVWNDLNQDGIQNNNEVGVSGVTISLINGTTNAILATVTSDAYGYYQFCQLNPGDYKVKFSLPTNYVFTSQDNPSSDLMDSDPSTITGLTSNVTLAAGDSNMTVDAGIYQPQPTTASVGDRVWFDTNSDGIQDATEQGVSGVTVTLYNCANPTTPVATTITDANGNYMFETVAPGSYSVQFTAPIGTSFTTQTGAVSTANNSDVNASGNTTCFPVLAGDKITYVDAGIIPQSTGTASIGDKVWNDANQDGIQDPPETGVAGVTVTLYDAIGTTPISTTITNGLGNYSFNGLTPGCYVVGFDLPSGYTRTTQGAGTDTTKNSDANVATGKSAQVCVVAGQNNPTIDAGIYNATNTNSIGDKVWYDVNKNGLQDATEYGYPGVVVTLHNCSTDAIIATTTTNANGNYVFDAIANGDYYVSFGFVPGFSFTSMNADVLGISGTSNSDANPSNGKTACVSLTGNTHVTYVDAGIYPGTNRNATSSLGDIVWIDVNANGIQDQGETGVSGVTVNLIDATTNTQIATTITDGLGNYIFTNLLGGNYKVEFTNIPSGYVFTSQSGNIDDATNSDANTTTGLTSVIALGLGEDKMTVDAGLVAPSGTVCLGNYVWIDLDNDGVQDANEPPVPGVTVKLYDNNTNTVLQVATTNSEGNYLFCGLTNGTTYSVGFENLPDGFEYTTSTGALNIPDNSDANPISGRTTTVTMGATDDLTLDGGIFSTSTAVVGNYVWYDEDADGIQDANEAPIPGVLVTLYDNTNTAVASAVTDADGKYLFTNVLPGTYTIGFEGYPSTLIATSKGGNPSADDDSNIDPSTNKTDAFTVTAGSSNLTLDAGYKANPIAGLGNYVWNDVNQNGLQDATEPGIAGVKVTLLDPNGTTVLGTAFTDGNGFYSFPNLSVGDYIVQFGQPQGFIPTTENVDGQGLNGATNSDMNITTFKTTSITLTAGNYNPNIDAGFYVATILPVILQDFTTVTSECKARVYWTTSEEHNSNYFELQRRSNTEPEFKTIAKLNAKGNTQTESHYQFEDTDLTNGNYDYKLNMVDIDSKSTSSEIKSVQVKCDPTEEIVVSPNPFTDRLQISIHSAQELAYTIDIIDITGRVISSTQTMVRAQTKIVQLDMSSFASSTYFVRVSSEELTKTFSVNKVK